MSQAAMLPASGPLIERSSGLVVPAHLAGIPEEPVAEGHQAHGGRDADGRRRIVFTKEARKLMFRLSRELDREDLAIVVVCKTFRERTKPIADAVTGEKVPVVLKEAIPGACGEVLVREGEDTYDPGFGCKCTRIHFLKGGA